MSSQPFWMSEADENSLHAVRLLNVEQRAFERVYKRLAKPGSLVLTRTSQLPTPPPDATNAMEDDEGEPAVVVDKEKEIADWREAMLLDFSALESSMVRIQLLQRSNEQERERYAAEKVRIMETAVAIKNNTGELRLQLEQAKQTTEERKKYDVLANKIFSNKMLKSRDEQLQMHEKLQKEIAEQEQEAEEYAKAVAARREYYFGAVKIALKGMRAIQHPEQPHDDEMKEVEGDEELEGSRRDGSRAPSRSREGTGEPTPSGNENGDEANVQTLKVPPRSRAVSQMASPAAEKDDVEMGETVATPVESIEEGEASESNDLMED